jgi:hypothetical protein
VTVVAVVDVVVQLGASSGPISFRSFESDVPRYRVMPAALVSPSMTRSTGWARVYVIRSLRRRAGAVGIPLSVEALDDRQTHVLRPVPVSDGWQERVREKLAASERAFLVAEKGHEEIHFRWRPGRGKQSVWGSMSFDAPSGDVVLDVRDGEGLLGVAGLGKGSSFAAVCQIAGVTGLESGSARG